MDVIRNMWLNIGGAAERAGHDRYTNLPFNRSTARLEEIYATAAGTRHLKYHM
jgi:hypothetical protein